MIEICCGSYEDALAAYRGGAHQVELNSALALGGLTPSLATLQLTKDHTELKVICMVRPRAAGFYYSEEEFRVMMEETKLLLEHGADGIAFGFLTENFEIDQERTKQMVDLIQSYQREAVFHRAIDVTKNYEVAIEQLIQLHVDRILTSGQQDKAPQAINKLRAIQQKYGDKIEILIGSGMNADNVRQLIAATGIQSIHSSCKEWRIDPTTQNHGVSYSYTDTPSPLAYDIVSEEKVRQLIESIG